MNKFHTLLSLLILSLLVPAFYGQIARTDDIPCRDDNYDCQITYYTKRIQQKPTNSDFYRKRGGAYFYKRNFESAMKDCKKAIQLNETNAMAHFGMANIYSIWGAYDKAVNSFTKAIDSDPRVYEFYQFRARAYFFKTDYQSALKDYNKAIELNADEAVLWRAGNHE